MNHLIRIATSILLLLLLCSCMAGKGSFNKGEQALKQRNYDQAVMDFMTAVEKNPDSQQCRLMLTAARGKAAVWHKEKADQLFAHEQFNSAAQEYQLALELDGSLYAASEGIVRAEQYIKAQKFIAEASDLANAHRSVQAEVLIRQSLDCVPGYPPALALRTKLNAEYSAIIDGVPLEVNSTEPITLNFKDTSLSDVFTVLTKLSGINFILDAGVKDGKTTLALEKSTFSQALELLLRMNKLDKKVLNSKTIILYPKTRDKQKQFDDQIIQTFYLSHMDAKKAVNILRTMLQVRKIHVQEDLNAIILRDSPDVIKLAQKLIEANDRGNAEVIFDLELIEVSHSDAQNLGLMLSNYSMSVGGAARGTDSIVAETLESGSAVSDLVSSFHGLKPFYAIPNASFNFSKSLGNTEILANPKIRVRNKEKAKVNVGSKEPVITATTSDTVVTESVTYIDVGIKLDIEPSIQLDNTVVAKLGLEVSNVSNTQRTNSGTVAYTITSTNAETTLTLKDGEQTVIGGLIREDNSKNKAGLPWLTSIPLIRNIFGKTDHSKSKREILLSITPHIVKTVTIPGADVTTLWSGAEDDLRFGRNFESFADDYREGQKDLQLSSSLPASQEPLRKGTINKNDSKLSQIGTPAKVVGNDSENEVTDVSSSHVTGNGDESIKEVNILPEIYGEENATRLVFSCSGEVFVGRTFQVALQVENVANLNNAPLMMGYDHSKLKLVEVQEGDIFKTSGRSSVFTFNIMNEQGKAVIGAKLKDGQQPVSASGTLAVLTFEPLQIGSATLHTIRTNFKNDRNEPIILQTEEKTVNISVQE